jgi:hypothetical protein
MKRCRIAWTAIILWVFLLTGRFPVWAQVPSEPKTAAETFLNGIDVGDPGSLYEQSVAARAKPFSSKDNFTQSINVWRIQSGGPVQNRMFVGATPLSRLQDGTAGDFYYVRYREGYPSAQVFVDVTLEHEGPRWLVVSYFFSPVPQQQQ